ncbi:serine hydrolase [Colwelliaceae bacterium BS250]
MRAIYSIILLSLLATLPASAIAEIPASMQKSLDLQLEKNSQRYGVVGQSVLILKNHKFLYKGQYGFANFELDVAINSKHLFPSYSVTKLFTSVLIMQQVENGTIELHGSIRKYLPYLPIHWQEVTVEHLLSHTSGIPRYIDTAIKSNHFLASKKAVFLSLVDEPEHFEIGTTNSYNNTNFLLLAAILEAKTAKTYQQLIAEVIITPLGLKNTGHASAKTIIKNMVTSYQGANGTIRRNIDIDWPEYTFAHSALYSTPEDLTTFMTAIVTGKFVSKETLTKLWQPMKLTNGKDGRYAFGFEYSLEDGYQHAGHDGGNRVKLRHYFNPQNPADNYTIAYLTNGNAYDVWTDVLAESVMSIVAPAEFELAALKEQFISAIFDKNSENLNQVFNRLPTIFNGEQSSIERFIIYRAYGLKYGSGAESSILAFEFLTSKYPNSANAQESLADTWAEIGNTEKAIESYKLVLKIAPKSTRAMQQIELLESAIQK